MTKDNLIKEIAERLCKRYEDKILQEKCTPILEPTEEVKKLVKNHLDFNKTFMDTVTPDKNKE